MTGEFRAYINEYTGGLCVFASSCPHVFATLFQNFKQTDTSHQITMTSVKYVMSLGTLCVVTSAIR